MKYDDAQNVKETFKKLKSVNKKCSPSQHYTNASGVAGSYKYRKTMPNIRSNRLVHNMKKM